MRRAALTAVALLLAAASPSLAQPRRPGTPAERVEPAPPGARREQIKKKIRAMRAYLLTEELALDEPTAARLFPVLSRYDDETDKLLERRLEIQRRLGRANPRAADRATDHLIDEALANQRAFWELEDRRIAELRKILTPGQTARLLVVLPELERKIRNQLRRAIIGRPRQGVSSPGTAGDDEDDDPLPDENRRSPRQGP